MSFAGVPRGSERADLIVFLNSKSDNPTSLPKAADAGAAAKPAEAPASKKKLRVSRGWYVTQSLRLRRFAPRKRRKNIGA